MRKCEFHYLKGDIGQIQKLLNASSKFSWLKGFLRLWGKVVALMLIVILIVVWAWAQQYLPLHPGFKKGNDYLNDPEVMRIGYIAGLYDGICIAPIIGSAENKNRTDEIYRFTQKMSLGQIEAITNNFLKEHPEKWHEPMNLIFLMAIGQECPSNLK